MTRRRPLLAIGLVAMAALAGCAVDDRPAIVLPTSAFAPASSMNTIIDAPGDRMPFPALAGLSLDGRPTVVNAWASWCAPCRAEAPEIAAFAAAHPEIRVVGLNVNDDPAAATDFAREFGFDFEQVRDPDGTLLASIPGIPPAGLPSTLVVDRDGMIAARIIGPVQGLASVVDQALGDR